MSRSVTITTPLLSTEEFAAALGIKGRRLKDLIALAESGLSSAKKRPAKKSPVQRAASKRVRSTT